MQNTNDTKSQIAKAVFRFYELAAMDNRREQNFKVYIETEQFKFMALVDQDQDGVFGFQITSRTDLPSEKLNMACTRNTIVNSACGSWFTAVVLCGNAIFALATSLHNDT